MKSMKRSMYSNETKKIRKLLNEEVKLGIHPSSDSETEEVDLHKEIHPLSHYLNNKEEMIEQMFSIIKGDKLMKMLPPILKDMPLDELKADCLIHLLGMSKKRIIAILEGKEVNSSSDSEIQSDSSSPRRKRKPIVKPVIIKQEGCSDISDNSEEVILIDPDKELFESLSNTKSTKDNTKGSGKSRKRIAHSKHSRLKNKLPEKKTKTSEENQQFDNQESESEDVHESSPDNTNSNEDTAPKEGKTLLEILELEMRARAIRALLHKSETTEVSEDVNALEKLSTSRNSSDELEKFKIKPKKKFRKKKHKNDDVIVITPKVVTIDLTDENDVSSAKKNQTELTRNNISENKILHRSPRSDSAKELEATIMEEISSKTVQINLIEMEPDCTKINNDKEELKSKDPDVSSELSAKSVEKSNQKDLKKTEEQKSSWAQRWLESKEVKKVVSTSKICGNIRKRIKSAKLAKQNQIQNQDTEQFESQEIHGSVDEYQLLSKSIKVLGSNNTSPLEVCNSESSLMSNEGECEKQTAAMSKSTISSVEQVQDVSSTKNETPTDGKLFQENVLDDSSLDNVTVTFENSESGDTEKLDLKQNTSEVDSVTLELNNLSSCMIEKSILNNPVSQCIDNGVKTNESLLGGTVTFENEQPDLNDTKFTKTAECSVLSLSTENDSDSYHSSDQIQLANQDPYKEFESLQSNITSNQHCNEGSCGSNFRNMNSVEADKSCNLNSIIYEENKNLNQTNEPETLEINITDEDRDIDGIIDEQSEINSKNTALSTTKVLKID